ncbi:MAG: hypothetical protein LBG05_01010 [Treponema sp.]|nr:hypothetical protein [Treponema sp.]
MAHPCCRCQTPSLRGRTRVVGVRHLVCEWRTRVAMMSDALFASSTPVLSVSDTLSASGAPVWSGRSRPCCQASPDRAVSGVPTVRSAVS